MSVSYTISWEEFLECCQDYLPKPSVASFIATMFVGVAVGAFGGVLTYAVDPGSKLLASIFCWLSFIIFLGAFWDLKVRTRRRQKGFTKECRATYDRLLTKELRFDFDGQKFAFESKTGKGEVPWAHLLRAVERQRVITLGSSTMVPKRVLSAVEVENLHRLALPSNGKSWSFHINFVDYFLTEAVSLWRRHPFLMAEAHAAGLWFFLMISYQMYGEVGREVIWGWTIAFGFLFLTITAQFWYLVIKYRTSHKELRLSRAVQFSARGVTMKTTTAEWFSAWQTFNKFRETRRAFLLYIDPNQYHLLPKSCITSDQKAQIRQALEKNLVRPIKL
jgi:hypothetical protein